MMTIGEMSRLAHISIRTLRHYDRIGLLPPAAVTDAGYRLYDESSLRRLHTILLFRELEFPLTDVQKILSAPDFNPYEALERQITLLTMKREHLDNLILLAKGLKLKGFDHMDFSAFDTRKIDDYAAQAKAAWQHTPAWQEYTAKSAGRTGEENSRIEEGVMSIMAEFSAIRHTSPNSPEALALVKKLQEYFTAHFYTCTPPILRSLADMYDGGGDFTRNIDQAGGPGTASFTAAAIRHYVQG